MPTSRWHDLDYTIFPIDLHTSPSHLESYKAIRLASLRTDPGAFSSNYAREAALSQDMWRERLEQTFRRTFVSSVLALSGGDSKGDGADSDSGVPHDHKCRDEVDVDTSGAREWIGMATIIGPTGTDILLDQFREAGVGTNWQLYCLVGMWVHPTHRGRGIGARLVKECLEWARSEVDIGTNLEKAVVLLVHDENAAGRALYSSVGFTDLEELSEGHGERWMLIKL